MNGVKDEKISNQSKGEDKIVQDVAHDTELERI